MFKNMKIAKKLILSFLIVTILASAPGVLSISAMKRINEDSDFALQKYGFATGDIGAAIVAVADSRRIIRDVVSAETPDMLNSSLDELDVVRANHEENLNNVRKSIIDEEGEAFIAEIEEEIEAYYAIQDKYVEKAKTATHEEQAALQYQMRKDLDPEYDKVYKTYTDLFLQKQARGYELSDQLDNIGLISVILTLSLMVASFIIAITFSIFIARGVSRPIKRIVEVAESIQNGNLDNEINIDSKDEIGELATTFGNMSEQLKTIISDVNYVLGEMSNRNFNVVSGCREKYVGEYGEILQAMRNINTNLSLALEQINGSSEQVAVGAEQMSAGAQALSQGAVEQASSIEELSATITDISEHIKGSNLNLHEANGIIADTSSEVGACDNHMKNMIVAMSEINENSGEIGKIIKTIEDIAFQTNILALNAAVEAARAGEAGKGFAVVADEVRNLAQKSAEAAKDTTALIENAIAAVQKGNGIADATASSLASIVDHAAQISEVISKIAQASEEQADAVTQVSTGIEQISIVVQTNSATAEESAATSEELNAQAQTLKELVGQFRLKDSARQFA